MPQIDPTMRPAQAIARTDAWAWAAGTQVWATWTTSASPTDLEWVPGQVLGPSGMGAGAREVEVEVYGGRQTVHRDDVELLLRHVSEKRRAILRRGAGLNPGTSVYEITYLHDGKVAGQSLARGDEIDSWRDDLRREGYTLEESNQ